MLLVVLIWGLNFTVTKLAFEEFPPLVFTAVRFTVASACIAFIIWRVEGSLRIPQGSLLRLTWLGFVGNSLYQCLFTLGLERTTASNSSLVLASMPPTVAALGALTGTERLSRNGRRGLLLASLGVLLVVASRGVDLSGRTVVGDALTVAAVLCWATFTIGVRRLTHAMSPLALTAWTTILGTPFLVLAGLPQTLDMHWGDTSLGGWGGLAYSTFLSLIVAYVIWNRSVRVAGTNRTAIFMCVTPLVATGSAVLLLHERPRPVQLAGGALILAGVLLSQLATPPPVAGSEAAER